ncbi:hypothetical protein BpHYR1_010583 [Brachionus plicatilis]|uniref:Uncharacterized protein n=1 Tax=Brachionus plicatilis TaxID=10195 RepID=A0A3M7QK15_BRAPC|nr:hypothetical protein BpHYR1_010583 [Brachionus plicatilis]
MDRLNLISSTAFGRCWYLSHRVWLHLKSIQLIHSKNLELNTCRHKKRLSFYPKETITDNFGEVKEKREHQNQKSLNDF